MAVCSAARRGLTHCQLCAADSWRLLNCLQSSAVGWSAFRFGRSKGTSSGTQAGGGEEAGSSIFVEPMRWMEGIIGELSDAVDGGNHRSSLLHQPLPSISLVSPSPLTSFTSTSCPAGTTQGKLYCPHCHLRLGSFNWSGTQDGSGRWVIPGFQVHKNKVDAVPPVVLFQTVPRAAARQVRRGKGGEGEGERARERESGKAA